MPATDLPPLTEGEFYWRQIEGLEAVDSMGKSMGMVDRLLETGANDVLVIKNQGTETLVPYLSEVVRKVDLESGVIELNWKIET